MHKKRAITKKQAELMEAAHKLCVQSEEMRARADRVMEHSENLHKSHERRRKLRAERKKAAVR